MLDADEKIEVEKMMDLRIGKLEARIAELVSKGSSRPAQRIILTKSDIAAFIFVLSVFVVSVVVASYFTGALLHDRFLEASLAITEGLSSVVGAGSARIVGDAAPWFFIITGWLTVAFVWWDLFARVIGLWKRNIKVEN